MKSKINTALPKIALMFAICANGQIAKASCHFANTAPDVGVCVDNGSIRFNIGDQRLDFDEKAYHEAWLAQAVDWLDRSGVDVASLCYHEVKYYLAVPELNPYTPALRAEMQVGGYKFVIFSAGLLAPEAIEDSQIGILSFNQDYPTNFGLRPRTLLVRLKDEAPIDVASGRVTDLSGNALETVSGGLFSVKAATFSEEALAAKLRSDSVLGPLIKYVNLNLIHEWIAERFQFHQLVDNCSESNQS